MAWYGAGAGGSQAGGRGAAPVATSRSCACRRHHADGSNRCALAAARVSCALSAAAMASAARVSCALSSFACRRLHCRLHVLCRTLSRCVGAFRSIRRVWCTVCVTPAAARFLLLVFRCPVPSCMVPAARRLLHVVSSRASHLFACSRMRRFADLRMIARPRAMRCPVCCRPQLTSPRRPLSAARCQLLRNARTHARAARGAGMAQAAAARKKQEVPSECRLAHARHCHRLHLH